MRNLLPLLALFLVGCGDAGPRTWPVSGKVVFRDGKPVAFGIVEFAPSGSGPGARASIDADGRFVLKTGDRLGAVADMHRVVIIQMVMKDGLSEKARHHVHNARLVHAKYGRFETSRLERLVEADKENVFTIEVEPGE